MSAQRRPACDWCAASCHNAAELERARELGMDFVVLGPVAATASHPHANVLGWPEFARLISDYPLPVYALGGLNMDDLDQARHCGAHGVGMLRAAWTGAHYR
jgi:8-oxo-dGTP diphosphatase